MEYHYYSNISTTNNRTQKIFISHNNGEILMEDGYLLQSNEFGLLQKSELDSFVVY